MDGSKTKAPEYQWLVTYEVLTVTGLGKNTTTTSTRRSTLWTTSVPRWGAEEHETFIDDMSERHKNGLKPFEFVCIYPQTITPMPLEHPDAYLTATYTRDKTEEPPADTSWLKMGSTKDAG